MAAPGLYLHIPFCSAICPYCDFSVLKGGVPARKRFVEHLIAEVPLAAREWRDPRPFDTVYFGGGTPSLLPPEDLARVLAACRSHLALATPAPWIFLEANPEDVTRDACAAWRELGVRTLSLGVQSFSDEALRFLGRRHSAAAGAGRGRDRAGRRLRHRLGRPHLRPARPDRGGLAARAGGGRRALGPGHLSCYQLTIHARHALRRAPRSGASSPRCPRGSRPCLFELTHRFLADAGYSAYEVSNFARSREHESRHNRKYWDHTPYLGLGPSAHSLAARRPGAVPGRRRPPLVERAAHAALGEPPGGGRAARRGRGVSRPEGAGDRGGDAGPAHHGRDRPRRLRGTLRVRPAGRERRPRRPPRGRGPPRRARRPRRAAGAWRRPRPDWPWPTAWPPRSTSRSPADGSRSMPPAHAPVRWPRLRNCGCCRIASSNAARSASRKSLG